MGNLPKIVADPEICHGKPTFEGTRIMVWQILEILEAGGTQEEIYSAHPTLPEGAIEAARNAFTLKNLRDQFNEAQL